MKSQTKKLHIHRITDIIEIYRSLEYKKQTNNRNNTRAVNNNSTWDKKGIKKQHSNKKLLDKHMLFKVQYKA
jgi:hypothetical protein